MAAPNPETVRTVVTFDRERGFTTGFRIITADERLRERRGVKAVLLGISGPTPYCPLPWASCDHSLSLPPAVRRARCRRASARLPWRDDARHSAAGWDLGAGSGVDVRTDGSDLRYRRLCPLALGDAA